MSSPMVDTVREIPLYIERDDSMDTGFPFDDDDRENRPFRSQLDDIAARHPEFAQHLGSFPFRSGSTSGRSRIPEQFGARFADRPFGDRFEQFAGFPFDDQEPQEQQKPYYQRYPEYYPQDAPKQQEEPPKTENNTEKVEKEEERSRRPKQNIQQSNTVDLGQKQESSVDDRAQRSMSAPPPNNRPRFVSSINIPVNQDQPSTSEKKQQEQPAPQERVIPIHVEGRDEPVLPKNFTGPSQQPPPPHPCTDKFFTQRSPNFQQYFNRDRENEWTPKGFPQQPPKQQQQEPPKNQTETPPPSAPKPQPSKPDPIDQIKSIQKDVSELMGQVEQFDGKPKDKQYLYLDEMLTRNLIKLDNIDTQGQENIRLARKEAIKCIEKCIGVLETKAKANVEEAQTEVASNETNPEEEAKTDVAVAAASEMDVEAEQQPNAEPENEAAPPPEAKSEETTTEQSETN